MVGKFSVNFGNCRKDGFHTHAIELGLVYGLGSQAMGTLSNITSKSLGHFCCPNQLGGCLCPLLRIWLNPLPTLLAERLTDLRDVLKPQE